VQRSFDLLGGVLAPKGRFPDFVKIAVDRFEDESGNDLCPPSDGERGSWGVGRPYWGEARAPEIFRALWWGGGRGPVPSTTRLKFFHGRISLSFAVERTRLVGVPLEAGKSATRGPHTITLREVLREGPVLRLRCRFKRPVLEPEREGDLLRGRFLLGLYDAWGTRLKGLVRNEGTHSIDREMTTLEWDSDLEFHLPDGFTADSIDLEDVSRYHTIEIPFNLDGVSLR
jgi:hypothetical protein